MIEVIENEEVMEEIGHVPTPPQFEGGENVRDGMQAFTSYAAPWE